MSSTPRDAGSASMCWYQRSRWGRGCKGQAFAVAPELDQPYAAFLHHILALRLAAGLQPGVAAAQRGVAGKGQLAARAEDADLVVSTGLRGRQQEGGLRQVGPVGEVLHLFGAQARAVQHHGQRVAQVRHGGEHIDLLECAGLHGVLFSG